MRFVLVHGGLFGARCWERLIAALGDLGHAAVAPDLPGHGARAGETASLAGYRDAVLDVLGAGDVLVGHSLGGLSVTTAADAAPDRPAHLVYLAAILPAEGHPSLHVASPGSVDLAPLIEVAPDGAAYRMRDLAGATGFLFNDCTPEDARRGFAQLGPQQLAPMADTVHVPRFWTLTTPRSYVQCTADHCLPAALTAGFARRLGVPPIRFEASHAPFLSRPADLARVLVAAVRDGAGRSFPPPLPS